MTEPAAPITVELFEARPNKMWPEALRQAIRFLRFSAPVPCAECARKRKTHWTMLVPFAARTALQHRFALHDSGKVHAALQPVCRSHLLAPQLPPEAESPTPP